jgi:LacI family transcriptional regulator
MGYCPDWRARALASRQTRTIGWLSTRPAESAGRVYATMAAALAGRLWHHGYQLSIIPVTPRDDSWDTTLRDARMDGCVVIEDLPAKLDEALRARRIPTVLLNVSSRSAYRQVVPDDRGGAELATRHLIELGHERIAFLGSDEAAHHFSAADRVAGFRAAMANAGHGRKARVLTTAPARFATDAGRNAKAPTAVVAYSDSEAIRLLRALHEAGVRVPQDMSVVAFNDLYPAEDLVPPLTTVAVPFREMAEAGADAIVEMLAGDATTAREVTVLPERLVVRASTRAPAKKGRRS